ncbi:MAG: hypothetical protein ACJ72H_16065 [Candidatus Sulfotelmatobacter sp.]
MSFIYEEDFNDGPGGWCGWIDNLKGPKPLEIQNSAAVTQSPWWIDYNHAPPGAGYLHLPYILLTAGGGAATELYTETAGLNRFIDKNCPTDFTDARISVRIRGELETRGAELVLLVQASIGGLTSGWALTGQPIRVSEDWTEPVITAQPDVAQWTCLGSRHDRTKTYGVLPLIDVLRNVNVDIMLILFPLNVHPMRKLTSDPHQLRAGKDYPVWQSLLPEGYIEMDRIRIEFARP